MLLRRFPATSGVFRSEMYNLIVEGDSFLVLQAQLT
jgi:hypothetical protein